MYTVCNLLILFLIFLYMSGEYGSSFFLATNLTAFLHFLVPGCVSSPKQTSSSLISSSESLPLLFVLLMVVRVQIFGALLFKDFLLFLVFWIYLCWKALSIVCCSVLLFTSERGGFTYHFNEHLPYSGASLQTKISYVFIVR